VYTTVIAAVPHDTFLIEALGSIYRQTLPPESVEIVVDSESESSRAWMEGIRGKFPDASFHVQSGSGMASALAVGIERVATPYVAFLDCDDLWLPEKQERQIEILRSEPSIDAVTCQSRNISEISTSEFPAVTASMFTATTFRTDAFRKFGAPDPAASHYVWLYRWWASARAEGICTSTVDYVGLHRHIHGRNSWIQGNRQAHQDLMAELRRLSREKRETAG
jgi:glycosyltransferase involved in cell wall biosynthesis